MLTYSIRLRKKAFNTIADIANATLDTIVSILISQGGKCSTNKLKFVTRHVKAEHLKIIENEISELIKSIKDKLDVDVVKVMNKKF